MNEEADRASPRRMISRLKAGPATAEARRQVRSWGLHIDLVDGLETGGGDSPNRVPAPHLGSVTSCTPQNVGVRVALPGQSLLAIVFG